MMESREADQRKPTEEEKEKIRAAIIDNDLNALQLLNKQGVDVTGVIDGLNRTGLHYAASKGHYNVISSLLNWGSEVDAITGVNNWTPLHDAANQGHTDVVSLLVRKGAKVNMKNKFGSTPLTLAVREKRSETVHYFINTIGMDPTQYDQKTQQKIKDLLEEASRSEPPKSADPQQVPLAKMGRGAVSNKVIYAYLQAQQKGTRAANQLKLVMMGAEGAGKTSTVGSLLDKQFQTNQESTIGAAVNRCIVDRILVSKWKQTEKELQSQELHKLYKTEMNECMSEISKNLGDKQIPASIQHEEVPPEVVTKVKEVVEAEEFASGDVRIIILDLGGQEIYYEVHFMFLSPEDVVLMTFDASKGLKQPVVCRQRLDRFKAKVDTRGMQTNLEVLETLFLSVYSHCGTSAKKHISYRIPTILMMATHAKGLTDQQKQDIIVEFYKAFEGRPFLDHLPRNRTDAFHFIDNEARELEVFTSIKQVILKAATATIKKQCPISYLQFESGLLQISESKSVITREEAIDIARKAGVEEAGVTELLLHYSFKGVLLFYPDMSSLQDFVFIDPQEVSDLVSSVISTDDCQPSSSNLQLACVRYDTYGLLEEALLDDILERCGRLQQKKVILDLLKKFDLAVEVSVNTKFSGEDDSYITPKSGKVFVVPSMLIYNERKVYQKKPDDVVVLYHYPDKFIFETVFNHVIVKTIRWCNKEGHHVQRIYRGTGYFVFKMNRQSFKLQQCPDTYSIKCYLTVHVEDLSMMLGQRQELLAQLKESLHEVHQTYIPSAKYPIGYVECPLEHEEGCLPHVRLDDINEVNDIECSKNEGQFVPRKAYMLLLTTVKGQTTIGSGILSQTPTRNQLQFIVVPRVAADWEKVAYQLEFEFFTIRSIQRKCRDDPEKCCENFLEKWVYENLGVGPKNWDTLLAALKKINQLTSTTQQIEDDLRRLTVTMQSDNSRSAEDDLRRLTVTTQPDNPLGDTSRSCCAVL